MQLRALLPLVTLLALPLSACQSDSTYPVAVSTAPTVATAPPATTTPPVSAAPSSPTITGQRSYTLAQVAAHATAADCWMVIHDSVYDVTSYIPDHEGGDEILRGCGKDATSLFEARPTERNTPHPRDARELLPEYQIGVLAS